MRMERQKGQRLNLAGDRVDCNQIKKNEQRRQKEFGAFGGKQVFARDVKPARLLDPAAQAKVAQIKEKQQDRFVNFMGSRQVKFSAAKLAHMNGLKTTESTAIGKSAYDRTKTNML